MKDIERRIQRLEQLASISDNSKSDYGELESCKAAFALFLKESGQYDDRALKGATWDGVWMFDWPSSKMKWKAFMFAWDFQNKRLKK
jgi:hypothetical protein